MSDISLLLTRWADGSAGALDALMPLMYERLHDLARQRRRSEPAEASLNTTGLVHEAWLKLLDTDRTAVRNQHRFLALASRVMRNLLVDHARARRAAKRGGGTVPLELNESVWLPDESVDTVADLDEALTRLEALDARQARIVEQRFFGGLSIDEVAATEQLSPATVKRELRSARAWLALQLGSDPGEAAHG